MKRSENGKRSYGTGNVTKVGDKYIARGMITGSDGGRRQVRATGQTRAGALAALDTKRSLAAKGVETGPKTVGQYLGEYLDQVKREKRYKTFESYRVCIRRLEPHIGSIRLSALRPGDIERAENALSDSGLSGRSVQQCHTVLRTALERAFKRRDIDWNPASAVNRPKAEKTERSVLTLAEVRTLIEETRGDRFGTLWALLATTGLRLGEALGLRWCDVDLEMRTLTVTQVVQRQAGKGIVIDEPKSEKSKRTIALLDIAVDALRDHSTAMLFDAKLARECGVWTAMDLVFPNWYGTPLEQITVERAWRKTRARLALPAMRIHDLRHTAVSHRVNQGDNVKTVQAFAGHSDVQTTLGVYAHSDFDLQRVSADRLNDAILKAQ